MKRAAPALTSAALTTALVLTGCAAVGPNYHVPASAAANAPAAQGAFQEAGSGTRAEPLPPRWWHLYEDPTLDVLEEQALAANTDLRIAAANLARARAVVGVAEGAQEPEFAVTALAEHARLSGESFLLDQPIPVANLGEVTAGVSYQVDLFGQIRREVEAARAEEAASEATERAVKVTLAAEVARAYLTQCAANEAVTIGTEAIAVDTRALDIARRLKAAGREGDSGVTRAEGRLAQVTAMVPAQRARARSALYRLAYLLGKAPADAPKTACMTIPTIARPLPVGDGAALIARRPDVHVAERQLAGATARIGVATAALYPHIGLGISGGSFGFLKDLGKGPANMWSIGGLLQWSIPSGGARARVRAANAEADAALARFDGTVLAALRETETALAVYAEDHNRAVSLDQALASAQQEADDTHRMRAAGRSPVSASIGAAQSTLVARASQTSAREALAMDQVNVFLALGGGW